ncbi:nuclear transport factor 2 family protein [uncultured Aquitalea sp.]|uniref:AraC family transcriptional regulator n=1 Tax=uncultured Aquitalea sp. TaxID=540272 RepID=UPI0025D87C43|nr:nuclear transport factor 2 family protein [uncultured Aquitalea sp.]
MQAADGAGFDPATHAVVLRYHHAWKNRDLDAILALYHPDIEYHDLLQNRVFRQDELRDYVRASLPQAESGRLEHLDRIRVDGDTAFIQYRLSLKEGGAYFRSSEAIRVRDNLVWRINEYATLQRPSGAKGAADPRGPLQKLGLSARQLSRMAEDLHAFFGQRRPFLDPDCSLPTVAAATGYSRNQLSYLFNQVLGRSFYQYLNEARVRHLLSRLEPAPAAARVDELAFSVGFNSLSSFYRAFREVTGMTPAAWLRDFSRVSAATTPPSDAV